MKDPETCNHEKFQALTRVGRLTEVEGGPVTGYTLDCKIQCVECEMFFEFVGVPGGMSPNEPRTNFDFTELRAPIRPFTGKVQSSLKYEVKPPQQTDSKKVN